MKSLAIILVCIIFISCKYKSDQNKLITASTMNYEVFDSTYYFQLEKAYKNNDTLLLGQFFEKWSKKSDEVNRLSHDSISKVIGKIFTEIYHPFNVEKYGWLARPLDKKYKYAVLPTEIKYKVIDTIKNSDPIYKIKLDTLRQFYATPEIGKTIRLYDIDPFRTSLTIFLRNDSYKKTRFLKAFIDTPISLNWKEYKTSPEILGILINKQLNIASVDVKLVSTGLKIYLRAENGIWKTKKIEKLWEE